MDKCARPKRGSSQKGVVEKPHLERHPKPKKHHPLSPGPPFGSRRFSRRRPKEIAFPGTGSSRRDPKGGPGERGWCFFGLGLRFQVGFFPPPPFGWTPFGGEQSPARDGLLVPGRLPAAPTPLCSPQKGVQPKGGGGKTPRRDSNPSQKGTTPFPWTPFWSSRPMAAWAARAGGPARGAEPPIDRLR